MQSDFAAAYRVTRRRYETARLLGAAQNATAITLGIALVAGALFGTRALVWLPISWAVFTFTEWRGVLWMKGARRGLAAGFGTMLLPLSVLRPCCRGVGATMESAACCRMPSVCWAVGAVMGLAMATLLARAPEGRRPEAVLGLMLGVTSVAITRCSMLFLGETLGLLGGIVAGVVATSLARLWIPQRAGA